MSCEAPQLYQRSTPKARKDHRCCECLGAIKAGEFYHIHAGVWESEWSTYKICLDCNAMHSEINNGITDYDEMTGFTGLHEAAFEMGGDMAKRFVEIKKKRGATVPDWMEKKLL